MRCFYNAMCYALSLFVTTLDMSRNCKVRRHVKCQIIILVLKLQTRSMQFSTSEIPDVAEQFLRSFFCMWKKLLFRECSGRE